MSSRDHVFLISLGCAKNLVDSEHMLGILKSRGFELVSDIEQAEIAVINTCGFIHPAVDEAVDTILEIAAIKKQGKLKKLIVAGCLVQRYGYKLQREIPEVDGWLGTGEINRIVDVAGNYNPGLPSPFFIGRPTYLPDHSALRIQTTPFYSAYLRISEGCSHRCSYCLIPALRGPFRSRTPESLIIETEQMVSRGVKEINLIAQDTTLYGKDLYGGIGIEDLLEKMIEIKEIRWIRLLYCHPGTISDRLLELMESEEAICPYLDVPLQHVNEKILRLMQRGPGGEAPLDLVDRIRSGRRRISIRTTLMVGFPGETEEIFGELRDFVKMAELDHLGVFVFSREKGAPAARLKQTVESEVAEQRLDEIMVLQEGILRKANQRIVGRVVPVLIEGLSPETDLLLKGRTATMAPEVDGQVLINEGNGVAGEIMPVLINEAHSYDLIGEITPTV
ncbi:MAG: 30S ribosomal protein S12 methylthiotransferase RimO [Thermodesulfobacteriota bacterium]|nr:30S ribosomal protein S12 methylthiotransferase RimO [Thermodesulfobacteriota bacterium]